MKPSHIILLTFFLATVLTTGLFLYKHLGPAKSAHNGDIGYARPIPEDQARPERTSEKPLVSIVLLLKTPRTLSSQQITAAAEKAFHHPFNVDDQYVSAATPREGLFQIHTPDASLGVIDSDRPYLDNPAEIADKVNIQKIRSALLNHRAWLSVDWVGSLPEGGQEAAYRAIAPIIAELLADDVLALYCTTNERIHPYTAHDATALRSPQPLDLFNEQIDDTVLAKADDAALAAAANEARRRWPEFLQAFNARTSQNQNFAVKKPFIDGRETEHMWILVERIDGDNIHGRINNDPDFVHNIKFNDPVTLRINDLEDWIYQDNQKHTIGGFQSQVLKNRKN